jgi:hypothetical protein
MDALLLRVSKVLILMAFWVGIPALLLSMLLIRGFRLKSRLAFFIFCIGLFGLPSFFLGLTLEGLVTGEAPSISRWGPSTVKVADDPQGYWLATSFWLVLSTVLLGFGGWLLVRLLRNPYFAIKTLPTVAGMPVKRSPLP